MNLFFDIETTGLFAKHHKWDKNYNEYPYILSMAWRFRNKSHYYHIYQEGREVPADATKANGITTAMANNKDKTRKFGDVFPLFMSDALTCMNIIGHNIYFDTSIFKANVCREYGVNSNQIKRAVVALDKDKRIDTMRATIKLFNKWPSLVALHYYLFEESFQAHDALEDAMATERYYYELVRRKII